MTLKDLREHALFQSNNDAEDLSEFNPALDKYINEGYDKLTMAYAKLHLDQTKDDGTTPYTTLANTTDAVQLPTWCHRAIGDYATYMIYRNGNALKQNRGIPYLQQFESAKRRLADEGVTNRGGVHMSNLYIP